jgi:hypothetical protein
MTKPLRSNKMHKNVKIMYALNAIFWIGYPILVKLGVIL